MWKEVCDFKWVLEMLSLEQTWRTEGALQKPVRRGFRVQIKGRDKCKSPEVMDAWLRSGSYLEPLQLEGRG